MKRSYQTEPATILAQPVSDNLTIIKDTPSAPSSNRLLILLSLLALYLLWGSTYLAMRIGLLGFPPFLMAGVRFLVAGSILYPILRLRGSPKPTRAQWL